MERTEQYEVTIAVYREVDRCWVSKCEELDIASGGTTFEKALQNIKDAIEVYVETLEEVGEFDRIFARKELRQTWRDSHVAPKLEKDVFRAAMEVTPGFLVGAR